MKRAALLVGAALLGACKSSGAGSGATPSVSVSPSSPEPAPSGVASAPAPSGVPVASSAEPKPSGKALVESGEIAKLVTEPGGRLVAELRRSPPARALVVLATKERPLAARECAAYFRIAERVAPGLVAPTALRALSVGELSHAADAPTRAKLAKHARVLADGKVEVALTLAPAAHLDKIDIAALVEGGPVWEWETKLAQREPPPEALHTTLSRYQWLLAADYVAQDQARKRVYLHAKSGRLTAAQENEAFSPRPEQGAVKDDLERLMHHMVYSKKLRQNLAALSREHVDEDLRWGDPPTLLVTPKQVGEVMDRAKTVLRVIDQRIKQRGEAKVLVLP
jgi:hypothetical protein